ncbi:LacI family DNA-binding transcriptional regulator [Deinococcus apachensis]|uniref:LacI family DNA-binding transcriptional regulator n=1 Tax=Deinococcus apachensis TaxID=309886 RepID=UPI0003736976|nr:LacI family DNA-binding transcriptional regulator [Deinococcus apachensis]
MAITLQELAQELQLSTATVSRAINRPETVADSTRRRVLDAVALHGYQPDAIARSLREGRSRSIGLVVSDIRNPFYAAIAATVEDVARGHGYSVLVCNANEDAAKADEALHLLAAHQVSGLIHVPIGEDRGALQRLRARGVPVVDLDRASGIDGAYAVLVDNNLGARLAAEHLLALGHRRLATIAGPLHLTTGRDRLEGFRLALEAAGQTLPWEYLEVGDFREASGARAMRRLLALPAPPTALFVANNEMMAGALAVIHELGLQVPRQLSLVGFDDARWAQYIHPPLTVVAQPVEAMAALAAEMLFKQLAGGSASTPQVLEPKLIVRSSTAPPFSV